MSASTRAMRQGHNLLAQFALAATRSSACQQAACASQTQGLSAALQQQSPMPRDGGLSASTSGSALPGLRTFASQSASPSYMQPHRGEYHATTILCKDGVVAMVGDGQVSAHVPVGAFSQVPSTDRRQDGEFKAACTRLVDKCVQLAMTLLIVAKATDLLSWVYMST
eukprot:1159733-Pelagomonas_calceolata.AAC.5